MIRFTPLLAAACVPHLYTHGPHDQTSAWTAPENTWELSDPPTDLVGEGFAVGDTVPDVRLEDQLGDEVSLWQFYGDVVVLDVSTMWCAPCRELAETTEQTVEAYADRGFVYVTVLQQDPDGNDPTLEDVQTWASVYGITSAPVLGDPAPSATADAIQQGQFPALLVLDRGLTVKERVNPPTEAELASAIESEL